MNKSKKHTKHLIVIFFLIFPLFSPLKVLAAFPGISLEGDNPMYINVGTPYSEPGATAFDPEDGDISSDIVYGGGPVNFFITGTHTLTYDVMDSDSNPATQVMRVVYVVAGDSISPEITISGDNPTNHPIGIPYSDAGATASDNVDGDITADIVQGGTVNFFVAGIYYITYDVSDSAGNPAIQASRTVNVVALDTTAPIITISGDNPLQHLAGTPYVDAGATATDDVNGNITADIVQGGTVNFFVAGTYYITYDVSDSAGNDAQTATRTVNVVNPDTIAPEITILGDNPQTIEFGNEYIEAGATSTDNVDGDLTLNIVIDNSALSTSTPGSYSVVYTVSDLSGNTQTATRTVNVVDTTAPALSDKSPDGDVLSAGTTNTDITFTSNEPATCYLSLQADINYASMTIAVSATATTTHEYTATGLSDGNAYNYYFRCQDEYDNVNESDFVVNFSVASVPTPPAPSGGGGGGGGGSPYVPPTVVDDNYELLVTDVLSERSEGLIILNWTNPSDASFKEAVIIKLSEPIDSYLSYEALNAMGEVVYQGSDEYFEDNNVEENLDYYYAIFSVNVDGDYSDSMVIEKKKLSSGSNSENPTTGDYSGVKNLANIPSENVEIISLDEARVIFYYNTHVDFNDNSRRLYLFITTKAKRVLSEQDKFALAFYIHEGSQTTKILGSGERTGVLNSYLSVFGKLPATESEWQDIIKIANGRWPTERNLGAENKSQTTIFASVYKRSPDMNNPHDNAAVTVITYGLRPADRKLDNEKVAIKIFRGIFSYDPVDAIDWDIVRAIAYSGATR